MNCFKKTSIFSLCLTLLLPISGWTANSATPSKKLVDKIAAVVNQEIILYSEFEAFRKGMEEEFKKGPNKTELENQTTFQKKALNQMIENHLLEQEIKALGMEATDSQVENVVAEIMKSNGLQNQKDLERALRGEGITYDEFVSEYRKRLGRSNLVNQTIRPKVKISDDEVTTELKKRSKTASQQFEYQVGMIFISKNTASAKEVEKIRKSINSISDFTKVADEQTEGPGKGQGGSMGWIDPSDLQSPLNETVKKMKKGNISSVITAENGFYILACLDTKSKASNEEEKLRAQIQEELMNTLITKNLNQYIMDLKNKAHIETFL